MTTFQMFRSAPLDTRHFAKKGSCDVCHKAVGGCCFFSTVNCGNCGIAACEDCCKNHIRFKSGDHAYICTKCTVIHQRVTNARVNSANVQQYIDAQNRIIQQQPQGSFRQQHQTYETPLIHPQRSSSHISAHSAPTAYSVSSKRTASGLSNRSGSTRSMHDVEMHQSQVMPSIIEDETETSIVDVPVRPNLAPKTKKKIQRTESLIKGNEFRIYQNEKRMKKALKTNHFKKAAQIQKEIEAIEQMNKTCANKLYFWKTGKKAPKETEDLNRATLAEVSTAYYGFLENKKAIKAQRIAEQTKQLQNAYDTINTAQPEVDILTKTLELALKNREYAKCANLQDKIIALKKDISKSKKRIRAVRETEELFKTLPPSQEQITNELTIHGHKIRPKKQNLHPVIQETTTTVEMEQTLSHTIAPQATFTHTIRPESTQSAHQHVHQHGCPLSRENLVDVSPANDTGVFNRTYDSQFLDEVDDSDDDTMIQLFTAISDDEDDDIEVDIMN